MAVCPNCGSNNPSYVLYCGICGKAIPEDLRKEATKDQPQSDASPVHGNDPGSSPLLVWCRSCGKLTEADRACPSCGNNPAVEPTAPARPKTPTPRVGGLCAIVAGVLAVIQGILFFTGEALFFDVTGNLTGIFILFGAVEVVFGLASINAGMNARQRKKFGASLGGSVLGMVSFGFLIGGFLGLVAVILIALSYDEFKS